MGEGGWGRVQIYVYTLEWMTGKTDPGYAGRHLRGNSTPPKSGGWKSKTIQRWGMIQNNTALETKSIYTHTYVLIVQQETGAT